MERKDREKQRKLDFLNGLLYQSHLHSLHQQPGQLSATPSKEPASRSSASLLAYLSHLQPVSQPDFSPVSAALTAPVLSPRSTAGRC